MDGRLYTPGAGHLPPSLVGRGDALRDWRLTLNDVVSVGRIAAEDALLTGPRGVGKTALLSQFATEARQRVRHDAIPSSPRPGFGGRPVDTGSR